MVRFLAGNANKKPAYCGFLPDLPGVRLELSHYYNSVRRFDDTLGKVLEALDKSGLSDNTLVILIADNGSAFPFAKANTYLASTRTPCLVRWPGRIKPGSLTKPILCLRWTSSPRLWKPPD